jgi:osmoprotectant transport system permease protein
VGALAGGRDVTIAGDTIGWLTTASNWTGGDGIIHRSVEHADYSLKAMAIALVIALPIGLVTGHLRRFGFIVLNASGAARAIPTLGLFVVIYHWRPVTQWPLLVCLVVIAVPPILANTYAGLVSVDPAARDAAIGMGMTSWRVLRDVELPLASPLVLTGIRSAAGQVIATATIARYGGLGGLGAFVLDGYKLRDYASVYGGAVVICGFVLAVEAAFALVQRLLTSPGLRSTSTIAEPNVRVAIERVLDPAVN